MCRQRVLVIGEVFVDTHLDITDNGSPIVRLGGIFHAARALSALGIDYALAYYAPDYLDKDINLWSLYLKTLGCYKLGSIDCAPNVMLIQESSEAGNQGYCNLLKDQAKFTYINSLDEIISSVNPTDVLLFPGRYNTESVMHALSNTAARLHIDAHYDSEKLLRSMQREIYSLIVSTSSPLFSETCHGSPSEFFNAFSSCKVKRYLLKENRGGATCYLPHSDRQITSPSHYVPTMHSVGVGDVYDCVFISEMFGNDEDSTEKQMRLAALCAAKYAETLDYSKFKNNVELLIKDFDNLKKLSGIRLPWEARKNISIYIAAPDFPDVDTTLLDSLCSCLCYHNFRTRRPIKENGLSSGSKSENDKASMYYKDICLLDECSLLIAVLLYNDPGTLVELGMFKQTGKPTIVFDPYGYCTNMFVRHTPDFLCSTISSVIDATYLCLGGTEKDEL